MAETDPAGMRYAAIDIGSNTFRLLIAEPSLNNDGTPWQTICYTHRIIRLGEGLHHSGKLSEAGMIRALQALREFASLLQQFNVCFKSFEIIFLL